MKRPASIATFTALGLAALAGCASTPKAPTPSESFTAPPAATSTATVHVVKVTDGDTLHVTRGGTNVTVRVVGINTPETVAPGQAVQCYGPEASAEAHRLLDGQQVTLTPDPTQDATDRYGRELDYVTMAGGVDYGQSMIARGYARAYRLTSGKPPQRYAEYVEAQNAAIASGTGMWGVCPR